MEALRNGFEKSMKVKLAQKCSSVQDEEVALTRAFKYFDSDNDGAVTLNEWLKAVERVGVIVPSVSDLKDLFNYYDTNHDGRLDYKEFATVLFSPPAKRCIPPVTLP